MIVNILSNNFSGETTNITFSPSTGGTQVITGATIPYEFSTQWGYGNYSIEIPGVKTCPLSVPEPTFTASILPTGTTLYNFQSLSGSTDLNNPTYVWSLQGFYDYSGNSITTHTGQTTPIGEFRETGDTLVSLSVVGEDLYGNPFTATTNDFSVGIPTTYRMFFGERGTNNLYYTDDLINYSSTTTNNNFSQPGNLEYSPVFDIWVKGNTYTMEYSTDGGITWNNASGIFSGRFKNVIWVPKLQIFASITDRSNYFYYSTDGINWSRYGAFSFGDMNRSNMIWDDFNDIFILSDTDGDIWNSTDGQTWTLIESQPYGRGVGLISYSGLTTAVYSDYSSAVYSYDGFNWSAATFTNIQSGRNTFDAAVDLEGNRVFFGSCEAAKGGFAISDDGINISGITAPTGSTANAISSIYNVVEDTFITYAGTQNKLLRTDDKGQTYTLFDVPFYSFVYGIKYNI